MKILTYTLFFFILTISSIVCKVLFVFEQCRHGAQGYYFAQSSHFVDQYDNQWNGNGELTGVGMRMHYLIGVRSREKYRGLFKNTYDPREIYVISTDQNRTISSAQSQLLGMFPPQTGIELREDEIKLSYPPLNLSADMMKEIQRLNTSALPQKLQIIPIHFFHHNESNYLLTDPSECPKMKYIKADNIKMKLVQDFIHNFNQTYGKKLLNFFNKKQIVFDYETISAITEQFISGYVHKRNLTELEHYGINLTDFYERCQQFKMIDLYFVESTPEVGVMAMSPTIRKIINWMDKSIENSMHFNSSSHYLFPKFVMYSGHDHTLVPMEQYLQKSFGTEVHYPDFAANQFFELHEIENSNQREKKIENYYVEYYYNDNLLLNLSYVNFKQRVLEIAWSSEEINDFCNNLDYLTIDYVLYCILTLSSLTLVLIITKQIINHITKNNSSIQQTKKGINIYKLQQKDKLIIES